MIEAIDLFCGIGGLTHGMERVGINVKAGIDNDKTCQYAYEANNEAVFLSEDIRLVDSGFLKPFFSDEKIKLLAGCAPCQPFSSLSRSVSKERKLDKWFLLEEFSRLVKELNPDLVTMENVPDLIRQDVFGAFIQTLKDEGYYVAHDVLYCPNYGLPQNRSRLVVLASKLGPIEMPKPIYDEDHYVTLSDAIRKLPSLKAGEVDRNDPIHRCSSLGDLNMKRIKQSKPGGSWKDWDPELVASCHKKKSGSTYRSVYGRLEWDKISPTITTQFNGFGNGRFGHPSQDRALSLREGAIIQSFPVEYKFVEPGKNVVMGHIARHIGNAVPVLIGEIIGKKFNEHIKEHLHGDRETAI